jgi:hypothetical protein
MLYLISLGGVTDKRALIVASGLVSAALALAGCGVSVAAGGENAASHPASGIFVSPTVGGGDISVRSTPTVVYTAPKNTPPAVLPPGLTATAKAVQGVVSGGCWDDSHQGNVYGAYDQVFWWQGDCGDTIGQVTMELYPSAKAATEASGHSSSSAVLARYLDGAVLVDVYDNAPLSVLSQLGSVKGLRALAGYGT